MHDSSTESDLICPQPLPCLHPTVLLLKVLQSRTSQRCVYSISLGKFSTLANVSRHIQTHSPYPQGRGRTQKMLSLESFSHFPLKPPFNQSLHVSLWLHLHKASAALCCGWIGAQGAGILQSTILILCLCLSQWTLRWNWVVQIPMLAFSKLSI